VKLGRAGWREAELVVVDVETTGLNHREDRVISYGAVPISGGRIVAGGAVYGLVNPGRRLGPESVRIHGILEDDLADAPSGAEAFAPLAAAMRDREPVGHAAWVERAFLSRPLRANGVRLRRHMLDTGALYRLHEIDLHGRDPGLPSLETMATALGLPIHRPHHALGDALTTAQAFLALATHFEQRGRQTLRGLRSAQAMVDSHRRLHPHG